jgi:hypothetical protein
MIPVIIEHDLIGRTCSEELISPLVSPIFFPRNDVNWKDTINEWFNIPTLNQEWFKMVTRENLTVRPHYIDNNAIPQNEVMRKSDTFFIRNCDNGYQGDHHNEALILLKYFDIPKQTLIYLGSIWLSLDLTMKESAEKIVEKYRNLYQNGRTLVITEELCAARCVFTRFPFTLTKSLRSLQFKTGDMLILSHEYDSVEINYFQTSFFKNKTNFYTCPMLFLSFVLSPKIIKCLPIEYDQGDSASTSASASASASSSSSEYLNFLPRCVANMILTYIPPLIFSLNASYRDLTLTMSLANLICYQLGLQGNDQIAKTVYNAELDVLIYELRNNLKQKLWKIVYLGDSLEPVTCNLWLSSSVTFGHLAKLCQKHTYNVYLCDSKNQPIRLMCPGDKLVTVEDFQYFSHFRIEKSIPSSMYGNFAVLYSGKTQLSDYVFIIFEHSSSLTAEGLKMRLVTAFKLPTYLWKQASVSIYNYASNSTILLRDGDNEILRKTIEYHQETLSLRLNI